MRRTKITLGTLVGCLVLCGVGSAGSASAALPELGRCVPVEKTLMEGSTKAHYYGGYSGKGCTKINPKHRGKYEFLPGPGEHNKFYGVAVEPEPILETVAGTKVECNAITASGEYTGPKSEKISKLLFTGCTSGGKTCQTVPVKEGEFEVTELEGELGIIKGPPGETAGWDLKKSSTWVTFTCGTTEGPTLEELEGSVIGQVEKGSFGDLNKMSYEAIIGYSESHGKQIPESFEGLPADVLSTTFTKIPPTIPPSQTKEQTGLLTTFENLSGEGKPAEVESNQEKLEVRTKPEGS